MILVLLQSCGNVNLSKAQSASNGGNSDQTGSGELSSPPPPPSNPSCVRKAEPLNTLLDVQIPANKVLYNSYYTRTLQLGEDILIVSDYSYGDPIVNGQPVSGATGVVEANYVAGNGSGVTPVNLPVINNYTWNSKAGTATSWCYVTDARSNLIDTAYLMVNCTSSNAAIGSNSYIYSFNKSTKLFTQIATSKSTYMGGLNINSKGEPLYIEFQYNSSTNVVSFQVVKYSGGAAVKIGAAFLNSSLSGYNIYYPGAMEDSNGRIVVNLGKTDGHAIFLPLDNQLIQSNWSRNFREVIQYPDSRKFLYYTFDWGPGVVNSLFSLDNQFNETRASDDNRYIISYQALLKNTVVKVGSEYGVNPAGQALISYDGGENFSNIQSAPSWTNQIVRSATDKFLLTGVDQYSNGHIKASVYRLICAAP